MTDDGVRMRGTPGTSAPILVPDLGAGTLLTEVDGQVATADGRQWRHLRTPTGTDGWVAATYLERADAAATAARAASTPPPTEKRYRVTEDDVRVRGQASLVGAILDELPAGTVVTAADGTTVSRDGHQWRQVRLADGRTGWMAADLLADAAASQSTVIDGSGLSCDEDCQFSFAQLRPFIEAAAATYGADPQVVAGIIAQETGFKNWRVHRDGTGHGLMGLDDGGLLPDFEAWCGQSFGRGRSCGVIPPGPQIEYCARTLASMSRQYGGAYNAARVWHRGPGLWRDGQGDNYEQLIRGHVSRLYG